MRTLAHFRPVEDNEKNKAPDAGEPLNSRNNKLLCKFCICVVTDQNLAFPSICLTPLHVAFNWCYLADWLMVHHIVLNAILTSCNIHLSFAVAFRLYDLDRDDKISRDELLQVRVFSLYGKQNSQKSVSRMWERVRLLLLEQRPHTCQVT